MEDEDGAVMFLTQREGEDRESAEYLLPQDFLGDAGAKFVKYCQQNGFDVDFGIFAQDVQWDSTGPSF